MNNKNNFILNFNYIKTVIYRVLPNVRYNFEDFRTLYSSQKVKSYFKGVRTLQEYPKLYELFSTNGFDMSLADKVRKTILKTKQIFAENLEKYQITTTKLSNNKYLCNINPLKLHFVSSKYLSEIFNVDSVFELRFTAPTLEDVLNSVNKTASAGLPNPFLKKREILKELREFLELFYSGQVKFNQVFRYPSAVFVRSQIRTSDLKIRLVHAVEAFQQSLESFYYLFYVSALPIESVLCIGLTQAQISEKVLLYDNLHTYCFDFKAWDNTRQPVLSVISFELIFNVLPLTEYQKSILISLRNYFLTMPIFHPSITTKRRIIGTVSGSGFTTLDNSLCNWVLTHLIMFDYCTIKGISPLTFFYKINVLGDDLILGVTDVLDVDLYINIAYNNYGATVTLENSPALPGVSEVSFLGSNWKNGVPYRPEKLLVASVIFGSGNFPLMNTNDLLQSRFIEIFGNSGDASMYWKRFNRPLNSRFFFFHELTAPFKFNAKDSARMEYLRYEKSKSKEDSRGFWFNYNLKREMLSDLWKLR